MCPVILDTNAYDLLVALGLVAGLALFAYRSRRAGIPPRTALLLGTTGLLIGAFGARLLHWLFVPGDYVPRYAALLSLDGGFALNGGILIIIAAVALICRVQGLDFLAKADVMAPSAPLAILFFRIGCFCNGCCVGRPTELPWGIHLPPGNPAVIRTAGAALHPSQLYAAFNAALILVVLLVLERRGVRRGTLYGIFLLLYGGLRTLGDLTRLGHLHAAGHWVLPANQAVNVAIALAGLVVLIQVRRRRETG